jgi:hypothetical protein
MTDIQKRKRGRPKTGRALTRAEVQQRYRERKYARLAAEPNEPAGKYPFPTMDELFAGVPTLDELMAKVSPEFRGALAHEAALEETRQERGDEDDANT